MSRTGLQVTHTTRYIYESPVSQFLNEVRLTPRTMPGQRVHHPTLRVDPKPVAFHRRKDYFGNDVVTFSIFDRHDEFEATASSIVEVAPVKLDRDSTLTWEEVRDLLIAQPDEDCLEASEFVFTSPYVTVGTELADYARASFTPGRRFVDAVQELSHRIHEEFDYQPKSTSIDMPLLKVLHNRRGVCQDFAHIMIGALRSLRLAARYVSGYVRSGGEFQGAQASHAWVSAFIPGRGWLDLDPTNDMIPSDGHVTLAWGRDYGDVTPLKGVTLGGGEQTIEVEVYVRPAEIPE